MPKAKFVRQCESPYILHSHQARVSPTCLFIDLSQSKLGLLDVLLQENKYQEVLEALRDDKVEWNWQGPANKR